MGGKALGYESKRLLKDEFLKVEKIAIEKLSKRFDRVLSTVYYKNKESFGDLDLIVPKPVPLDIANWLFQNFNTTKVVSNGDSLENSVSISFDHDGFQIDLIFVHPNNLDIAHFYYSYNDLNNYVSRVATQFGMKFGFNGLFYETSDQDILISKDRKKIYTFLGFSYQRYVDGFNTLEETFDYIILSKYFCNKIYQWDELNNINRARNKKRPNYQKFLNYLIDNKINSVCQYPYTKDAIDTINSYFPEAKLIWNLNLLKNNKLRHDKVKEIINTPIIKELLNCDWTKARTTMDQIYAIPNVEDYLVGLSKNEIEKLIKAASIKDSDEDFEIGTRVVFRTNDNTYYNATVIDNGSNFCKLEMEDMMVYKINKDRIKKIENWFNFKTELV